MWAPWWARGWAPGRVEATDTMDVMSERASSWLLLLLARREP
jgi:hypothetical protein